MLRFYSSAHILSTFSSFRKRSYALYHAPLWTVGKGKPCTILVGKKWQYGTRFLSVFSKMKLDESNTVQQFLLNLHSLEKRLLSLQDLISYSD